MSDRLHEIQNGYNEYLLPLTKKKTTSERSRIEMRKYLLALEKLSKNIRKDIMAETKQRRYEKKQKKNISNTIEDDEEEM